MLSRINLNSHSLYLFINMLLANYSNEQSLLRELTDSNCSKQILLIRGQSGSGKTALIRAYLENVPQTTVQIKFQLGKDVGITEIFYRMGGYLGWDKLNQFTQQINYMQNPAKVQIDRNWLLGINNHINVVLKTDNSRDLEDRRVRLTEALFRDISTFSDTLILVIDAYENAVTEIENWISGPFLARVAQINKIKVIISGQKVPDDNNIEWGNCCQTCELLGVKDAEQWIPIIESMKRKVPMEPAYVWIAGICHALKGNPDQIMKVIQGLPRV